MPGPKSAKNPVLDRIRRLALAMPEAEEVIQFGQPFFKVRKKPFAVYSDEAGHQLSIKVEKASQPIFLEDPRFHKTPYIGNHGWVTLQLDPTPDWEEVEGLITGSYDFVRNAKKKQK